MNPRSDVPARPAALLDRDGVLNEDFGYVFRREDFRWRRNAVEAVRFLNSAGYHVFVITNQSGIARGYFSEDDVRRLHDWMNEQLALQGAHIDAYYYCPHHPEGTVAEYRQVCNCRKPATGMIETALREWPVARERSFVIGDSDRDVQAALAAGLQAFMVRDDENLLDVVSTVTMRLA